MSPERYVLNSDGVEISEDGTKFKLDVLRFEEDDDYAKKVMLEFEKSPRRQGIPLIVDVGDQYESAKSKFSDEIRKALEADVQTGFLRNSGVDENGKPYMHRFSFAVAMGAHHYQAKYRKLFTDNFGYNLPLWVKNLHPHHIRLLCELSLENLMPLPERFPSDDDR